LAAVIEGPDSKIVDKARAKAYPTEERFGIVWVFVGEGRAPALDEDLPPELLEPNTLVQWRFFDWSCNWRTFTENAPDMLHSYLVHRASFNLLFQKIPACGRMSVVEPLSDGKGIRVARSPISMQAEYRGLGKFPRHNWWRILKGTSGGQTRWGYVRMPGHIVTPGTDPFLKYRLVNIQFPLPVEEYRTRILNVNITFPRSQLQRIALRAWYRFWYLRWHIQFLNQDRRLIESQTERYPEKLSASDTGVIQWRRFAIKTARQPDLPNYPVNATSILELRKSGPSA
jgi:phenylpropionate dioxygenase-like ring-hydroxylating dioxygenase large terminal subunit